MSHSLTELESHQHPPSSNCHASLRLVSFLNYKRTAITHRSGETWITVHGAQVEELTEVLLDYLADSGRDGIYPEELTQIYSQRFRQILTELGESVSSANA